MRLIAYFICFLFLAAPAFGAVLLPYSSEVREQVIFDSRDRKSEGGTTYIAFLGDYGLRKEQYDALDGRSKKDLAALLAYLHGRGDVIVNFEFLLPESDIFSIDFLAGNHVTAAIVSNNHACDGGTQGLLEGARQLSRRNIEPFGTFDKPYFGFVRNGSKYAVYALTEALDVSCSGVNTARARDHRAEVKALARSRTVIVYAHDPGPSFFVTDYEEQAARRYLDMGASMVLMDGSHNMKGARLYGRALGVFGLGNFLLTYRDSEEFLSVAAIAGFERGKPVYLGIIPFYDKRGAVFRLLHGKEFDAAASLYRERGLPAGGKAYRDASTVKLVRSSVADLLHGRNIERIKWKHVSIFLRFLYHNYFWPLCLLAAFLVVSAVQAGRLVRRMAARRQAAPAKIQVPLHR
jgi:hypothetical protein